MSIITGDNAGNILTGTNDSDTIFGLGGDDVLSGLGGDDSLDGGSGDDTLSGGLGNDSYVVDSPADIVMEGMSAGLDTVISSLSYTLGINLENLTLAAMAGSLNGTGNGAANTIIGNESANALAGLDGNDSISGGDGNDSIDGGKGTDTMAGGNDDDTYLVDSTTDVVSEAMTAGTDTVNASATYALSGNVENLNLTGTGAINGTGNEGDNVIAGNSGANKLSGLGGLDLLAGGGGNDTLDGGIGADTAAGGTGDDVYTVDDPFDLTLENLGEGKDTVLSTALNYALLSNIENLSLVDDMPMVPAVAVSGSGNELANVITGNKLDNSLFGLDGNDTVLGGGGIDSIFAGNDNDSVDGGAGDDFVNGEAGADKMSGGLGNDSFVVETAGDTVIEAMGAGIDEVISLINYTLAINVENLTLVGSGLTGTGNGGDNTIMDDVGSGNSMMFGLAGNDKLISGGGNETLDGGMGMDTMTGNQGDDRYIVDNAGDSVVEEAMGGTDTVFSSVSHTLADNVEALVLTGSAANGTGNGGDNTITGNGGANLLNGLGGMDSLAGLGGNDTLDGGMGDDTAAGGTGNDTYLVDGLNDQVIENLGEGTDTVQTSISLTLAANVENLVLQGMADIAGTGNGLANVITGNGGNNTLDGGLGNDTLAGGAGNDSYAVDSAKDVVTEALNQGTDTVTASVSYTISGVNVENLTLAAMAGNINGTGNGGNNTLTGNEGANALFGLAGLDSLSGGAGMDSLDGGLGADTMAGGTDDDTYVVDSAMDSVVEAMNEGTDTVRSAITHTLALNVENLVLTGTGAINGTGNGLGNTITGGSGANLLSGLEGDDSLQGLAGNDTLTGGVGMDTLDGGVGMDSMAGGTEDDTYIVDSAMDKIGEDTMAGTDTVLSSINHTLAANVENLTLTGAALSGTGNELDNTITGNGGNNALFGLAGFDSLFGGAGNDTLDGGADVDNAQGGTGDDTYLVDDEADMVVENMGEGKDTVRSAASTYTLAANLESLVLIGIAAINGLGNELDNAILGNVGDNALFGDAGNDTVSGDAGDDVLLGDLGNDSLAGGAGNDVLFGDVGNDTVAGGTGDDVYNVDDTGDVVTEASNAGTDTVVASVGYTLGIYVENLTLATGAGDIAATGNAMNNIVTGNDGNNLLMGLAGNDVLTDDAGDDTLNGGAGADSMTGGLGNDSYVVDNALDLVMEDAMEGTDSVLSSITHTLAANVENLTLTGTAAINGTGNGLGNAIAGNIGANLLSGLDGADTLLGGAGNDTLTGGTGMDLLTGGQGTDTLTGGADSDRFDFNSLDGSVDTVTDFSSAAPGMGGDVLDLADLLVGFDPMTSMIDNFVRYTQQGNDTRVQVNADGTGMDFVDVALLQGVMGVSASQALANGNLDVTPDV